MELGEYITKYRREAGYTLDELSARSGVPKGTINKIIAGTTRSPTLDSVLALARALGHPIGDFLDGDQANPGPGLSADAVTLARDFDSLDLWGQRTVRHVADDELARLRGAGKIVELPRTKVIPLLGGAFAAGPGEPDLGNPWTDHEVPADSPAEFAIRITGDSMEPYLEDGSVALCRKTSPRDGEVGAFLIDGEFLCKQMCVDITGTLHLFSLNRKRRDMDRHIPRDGIERQVMCFGTVLMKRVPLPLD